MRAVLRVLGTALAVAVVVGLTPAVADATPRRPSDNQIDDAQAAAQSVVDRIEALSHDLDAAQDAVDGARAEAAIALDEYQATHDAAVAAKQQSDAAAAASAEAAVALLVARDDVIAFARRSYMDGSSYSGAASLLTAADPGELIQRAALLEAAGSHRSDVLDTVTVLEEKATAAEAVARDSLATATALEEHAATVLADAQQKEAVARQESVALETQKADLDSQLAAAQDELATLIGARAAADRAAQVTRPSATPPPSRPAPPGNPEQAGNGNADAAQVAIAAAMAYRGTPYAWGGGGSAGPGPGLPPDVGVIGFDCSGLTQYAYARAGISIPRNSRAQFSLLPKVSSDDLRPGDLVFWATDPSDPDTIHHVALYLGNGRVVQAPESGDVVKESPMWWAHYAGAVRPTA